MDCSGTRFGHHTLSASCSSCGPSSNLDRIQTRWAHTKHTRDACSRDPRQIPKGRSRGHSPNLLHSHSPHTRGCPPSTDNDSPSRFPSSLSLPSTHPPPLTMSSSPIPPLSTPPSSTTTTTTTSRSITDLIWYLKTSFRDSDFEKVEEILINREKSLKETISNLNSTHNSLTTKLSSLESRHRSLEEECRKWRESEGMREKMLRLEGERKGMTEMEKRMGERCRKLEEEVKGLEKENKGRIVELVGRNMCLESEERRAEGEVEKLRKEVEERRRRQREMEEEAREALERNRCLELEKEKIAGELEETKRFFDCLVARVVKLEKEVALLLPADIRVSADGGGGGLLGKSVHDSCHVRIDKALASEQHGDLLRDEKVVKLVFSPKHSPYNSVPVAEKPYETIDIIDSDEDVDQMSISNMLKRKRSSPQTLYATKTSNHSHSIVSSELKRKATEDLTNEPASDPPSAASFNLQNGKKSVIPSQVTTSSMTKCEENLGTESSKLSSPLVFNATDVDGTLSKSDCQRSSSPVVNKYIASCQRSNNPKWEHEVDLLNAFDSNLELCAKAICALYRQHMKSRNGPPSCGSKGFGSANVLRGTALGKFLVDGDPMYKMKKSVSDLKLYDPKGPEDLQKIARECYRQLFCMFQRKEDPFLC